MEENKFTVVDFQLLVINIVTAILASIVMRIIIINVITNGVAIPFDSEHFIIFLAILIPSVAFGYAVWILLIYLSLIAIIEYIEYAERKEED